MLDDTGNAKGYCKNVYCDKGEDGKRAVVAVRDLRDGAGYCSRPCASMSRYKKRYRGTNSGPVDPEIFHDKMNKA